MHEILRNDAPCVNIFGTSDEALSWLIRPASLLSWLAEKTRVHCFRVPFFRCLFEDESSKSLSNL